MNKPCLISSRFDLLQREYRRVLQPITQDKDMLKIIIEGQDREGKTGLARLIGELLRTAWDMPVIYKDENIAQELDKHVFNAGKTARLLHHIRENLRVHGQYIHVETRLQARTAQFRAVE